MIQTLRFLCRRIVGPWWASLSVYQHGAVLKQALTNTVGVSSRPVRAAFLCGPTWGIYNLNTDGWAEDSRHNGPLDTLRTVGQQVSWPPRLIQKKSHKLILNLALATPAVHGQINELIFVLKTTEGFAVGYGRCLFVCYVDLSNSFQHYFISMSLWSRLVKAAIYCWCCPTGISNRGHQTRYLAWPRPSSSGCSWVSTSLGLVSSNDNSVRH